MKQSSQNYQIVIYLIAFYLVYYLIALLSAYWFGIGWFFLIHTLLGLLNSIPLIRDPVYKFFFGSALTKPETKPIANRMVGLFTSKRAIFINIVNVILTIFSFWKVNIPLYMIIK